MKTPQLEEIPLAEIELTQFLRKEIDPQKLSEITRSIELDGLFYPVRLIRRESGKYFPWDGMHRILGFQNLGRSHIPALVETWEQSLAELLAKGLSANSHRSDNSPVEKGEAIARIMEGTGWTGKEVAERLSYSPANVAKLLACRKLPEPLRDKLHRGELGLAAAYELTKVTDPEEQARLADRFFGEGQTRTSFHLPQPSESRSSPEQPAPPKPQRAVALLGEGSSVSVSAPDLDFERFLTLLESLLSKGKKSRNRGLALPAFLKLLRNDAHGKGA